MRPKNSLRYGILAAVSALALLGAACANDDEATPTPSPDDQPSAIGVTLQEWSVIPDQGSAPGGEIAFEVSNVGMVEHEFMVMRTDLALTDLPTLEDGSLDVDGEGLEVVHARNGAMHEDDDHDIFQPGDSDELAFQMSAGSYLLVCNLITGEDDEQVHFALGMRIPFTVE